MCGIFGIISKNGIPSKEFHSLAKHSEQRGIDSSGLFITKENSCEIHRATKAIHSLLKEVKLDGSTFAMGHSRLITNGLADNQPVYRDSICVIHNGIVVNNDELWGTTKKKRNQEIDTEIIAAIAADTVEKNESPANISKNVLQACRGVVACALALPKQGKLCLFSNNGSLYTAAKGETTYFASERYPLEQLKLYDIKQIREGIILEIPCSAENPTVNDHNSRTTNLIPSLGIQNGEEKLLQYHPVNLKRCTKCILPETMPFIKFDDKGECNYCNSYKPRNNPKPKEELFNLINPYRRKEGLDCIVPFSGGRDSCYGLHLIIDELKMKPVTYTYDWGMVTDLGRRNISIMCAELGVENIIVAADISKKRRNIKKNLTAWLKSPHLGMMALLTAGDKHFFRHVETIKKQTGINLNLWGVNPLEVTHFKTGFLGIAPDFAEKRVYSHGAMKQLCYHAKRFRAMCESPGYFNRSLWDTLSGEYYRSFTEKTDYYHIFDYWRWDETIVDSTLESYGWEKAIDTNTTWRIGDGTAAFYNYIYQTVAGFTEHDTFRSNQIREGELTREKALELVEDENRPRYENIKWYLDTLGMSFKEVINTVNGIPKLYNTEQTAVAND